MIRVFVMNASEFVNNLVQIGLRRDYAAYLSSLDEISHRGLRSFGTIDLLGWPQIIQTNSQDTIPAKSNMPIIATGIDGRWVLLDCDRQSIVLCDQFDPGHPGSFPVTQLHLNLSLQTYLSAMVAGSPSVPASYEEALQFAGRTWHWEC